MAEITGASVEQVSDGVDADMSTEALIARAEAEESGDNTAGMKSDRDVQMGRNQPKKVLKAQPNVNLSQQEDDSVDDPSDEDEAAEPEVYELKVGNKTYQAKGIDALKAAAQRGIAEKQAIERERAQIRSDAKRMQALVREAEEERRLMRADPAAAYRKIHGDKAEELMESILLERAKEHAELQGMTPRERELYQAQKEYKAKLAGFEKQKADQDAQADEQLVTQQRQQIEATFTEALTKHDLPVNNATVRVMAAIYKANIEAGVEMTAEQAANATREQLGKISSHVIKGMTAESFVKAYPELAQSVRQHFIKNRNATAGDVTEVAPRGKQVQPTQRKRISSDEQFQKDYQKLLKQGDRDLERLNKGRGY